MADKPSLVVVDGSRRKSQSTLAVSHSIYASRHSSHESALGGTASIGSEVGVANWKQEQTPNNLLLMQTEAEYKVPYSRSFTDKTATGHTRPGSTIDSRHVHVYLRRQGSRTSVYSTASAGLANSDNISLASSSSPHSRPVSAEGNCSASLSSQNQKLPQANTRIVLPNPLTANRLFPSAASSAPRPPLPSIGASAATALTRSASIPSLRRRPSYLDKLVCQVLDYLFVGGIEAAYNANLLCRLNIEYLIDISNVEPLKVPRNKRSDCPCLCSLETAHSRARMSIMIEENSQLDLIPYFDDVNRFIDSARGCGKNVLVHSYNGKNRCAALVVQYLMKTLDIGLDRAVELLSSVRADASIGENFHKSLRRWETILQQNHRQQAGAVAGFGASVSAGRNITFSSNPASANAADKLQNVGQTNNGQSQNQSAKKSAWM